MNGYVVKGYVVNGDVVNGYVVSCRSRFSFLFCNFIAV